MTQIEQIFKDFKSQLNNYEISNKGTDSIYAFNMKIKALTLILKR